MEQVVLKALEKDINRRFATAGQMARAPGYGLPLAQSRAAAERPGDRPAAGGHAAGQRHPVDLPLRLADLQRSTPS